MPCTRRRALLRLALSALALGVSLAGACSGAATSVRAVSDPAGDDYGPGSYIYPTGPAYVRSAFDLREVRLESDGRWVTVVARFARPVPELEGHRLTRDHQLDLFLPTVDLYFDLDLGPGTGENRALHGRNVRLPAGLGWELCVVLSPVPTRLRQVLPVASPQVSVRVLDRVRVVGDTLRARFPLAALQGRSVQEVAFAVAVTGTVFASSFRSLVQDMVPTAWVREVSEEPGTCDRWDEDADGAPCTFGGCEHCGTHPRVIDALHPHRGEQEEALGDRDPSFGGIARLPMVLPVGTDDAPTAVRVEVSRPVTDRRGAILTVQVGDATAPEAAALLEAVDAQDEAVATVVVLSVHGEPGEGLMVLRAVEGDPAGAVRVRWVTWEMAPPEPTSD